MSTRPAKRAKLDSAICSVPQLSVTKNLNKLGKPSLCALAAGWFAQQRTNPRAADDSDEEDEEQEGGQSYEDMRDDTSVKKARVMRSIQRDWVRLPSASSRV